MFHDEAMMPLKKTAMQLKTSPVDASFTGDDYTK